MHSSIALSLIHVIMITRKHAVGILHVTDRECHHGPRLSSSVISYAPTSLTRTQKLEERNTYDAVLEFGVRSRTMFTTCSQHSDDLDLLPDSDVWQEDNSLPLLVTTLILLDELAPFS
jgi:hypothetical protein